MVAANKLNAQDFRIVVKNGLAANLTSTLQVEGEPVYTTDEKQLFIADGDNVPNPVGGPRILLAPIVIGGGAGPPIDVHVNRTATVPAGYVIDDVFIQETAGHSVTGGIKIGTTDGGTEIATTIAVGANSFTRTFASALNTSGPFSPTAAQTIYIQAVVDWNSAVLNIIIPLKRAIP